MTSLCLAKLWCHLTLFFAVRLQRSFEQEIEQESVIGSASMACQLLGKECLLFCTMIYIDFLLCRYIVVTHPVVLRDSLIHLGPILTNYEHLPTLTYIDFENEENKKTESYF